MCIRDRYKVKLYSTFSEKKTSIVERFNRTLKTRMYRERGHYRWLPGLVKAYNDSVYRRIGMKPSRVNESNERVVLERIKKNTRPRGAREKKPKFKAGDRVRVSKHKMTFAKGYTHNWINEIFTVHAVQPTVLVT